MVADSEITRSRAEELSRSRYGRWYDELMAKARSREPLTGYVEKHHILPQSMGGTDQKSNLVALTYREHFIAHWLLTKFTTGQARRKMLFALGSMRKPVDGRDVTSRQYGIAKRASRDAALGHRPSAETRAKLSAAGTGRKHTEETRAKLRVLKAGNKNFLGHHHTDETKAKLSAAALSPEKNARRATAMIGNKHALGCRHTEDMRAKKSERQRGKSRGAGRKLTDEHKAKLSAVLVGNKRSLGFKHTDETRAKLSAANRGKKMPPGSHAKMWATRRANGKDKPTDETRAKISASLLGRKMPPKLSEKPQPA